MGAYLSEPNREKESVDCEGENLSFGASSMQGWRMSQEDAHNCCLDYDKERNMSFFAVYDGHGGSEVAQYTAMHFPGFTKNIQAYKEGKLSQALEDAFLAFDEELTKEDTINKLKELAGVDKDEQGDEERQEEVAGLYEEADMPLEQLLERYQSGGLNKLKELKKKEVIPSPALRAKKDSDDKENNRKNDDIKENLEEKLVNGETDCNGKHTCKDETKNIKAEESKLLSDEADIKVSSESEDKSYTKDTTTTTATSDSNDNIKPSDTSSSATETSDVTSMSSPSNANKGSSQAVPSIDSVPDSTQAESSNEDKDSVKNEKEEVNGEAEVSSSSEGQGSRSQSSGGSSCGPGSGSSSQAVSADSSSKSEACSSSGRKRSGRSGVIPAEGEDESSFDEDEETTDEDDSDDEELDEEALVEDDSEDEYEGEIGEEEEEDDEEEEEDVIYGGIEPGADSGCTAVVALLNDRELFVANAGDSRCVLCRDGKAVDMSFDHKPEDEIEMKRILKAGGQVTPDGRVNGGLNLSRAIGDHVYKRNSDLPLKEQMITALPDVRCINLEEKDEFMVLACDGIWNSLSSQDAVNFIRDRIKADDHKLSEICEEMFEFCLAPNTSGDGTGCDNMTCIIVKFKEKLLQSTKSESGSTKRRASSETTEDSSEMESKKAKGD